eukprot:gene5897-7344_t
MDSYLNTTKSVILREFGGPDVIKVEEIPIPEPLKGEVRVRVDAVGLNRVEQYYRNGTFFRLKKPGSIGVEGAGTVEKLGEGVDNFKIGDRVSLIPNVPLQYQYPTNREHAVFPAISLVKNPDIVSNVEMASVWLAYLTGYFALFNIGRIQKGDFVVITAASSSSGLAAIQLAKAEGAIVIATSRTSAKHQQLLDIGADYVISTSEENIEKRIMEITNGIGANIIYDPVAGPAINQLANATKPKGTIIIYGLLSDEPTPFPLTQSMSKNINIKGYSVHEFIVDPTQLEKGIRHILNGLSNRKFKSIVGKTFKGIESVIDGHKYLENKDLFGKIVIEF